MICAPCDIAFKVIPLDNPVSSIGSVSRLNIPDFQRKQLSPFVIEYPGAKTKLWMALGDSYNLVRSQISLDGTVVNAKSYANGESSIRTDIGPNIKRCIASGPIYISAIVFNLNHGAYASFWQFDDWYYGVADIDGQASKVTIPIAAALRNTDLNDNFLAIQFVKPLRLDIFRGLFIPIPAGYEATVHLSIVPIIALNRY